MVVYRGILGIELALYLYYHTSSLRLEGVEVQSDIEAARDATTND